MQLDELIKFTNNGIYTADYIEIYGALVDRYKEIYGSDIDLSTGTADGVWISNISFLIDKLFGCIVDMYKQLNLNEATGAYLDALCSLSNIYRKPATKSNAYVTLTYRGPSSTTFSTQALGMLDVVGKAWYPTQEYTFAPNETKSVYVECEEYGKMECSAGTIIKLINASLPFELTQSTDGNFGLDEETDEELRIRQQSSSGAQGITSIGSLVGSILKITGIRDCYVYNNNTDTDVANVGDGTSVLKHSIYVVVRREDGVTVDDSLIGTAIFNKLTPGIPTTLTTDTTTGTPTPKSYQYIAQVNSVYNTYENQFAYWKEAVPIHPTITINLTKQAYYDDSVRTTIGNALISYANSLPINQALTSDEVIQQILNADPQFKGKPTFRISSAGVAAHTNTVTYYKYTTISSDTGSGSTATFTIT